MIKISFKNPFKHLFKHKPSLRERCLNTYGEDFVKIYDLMGNGIPVGNIIETTIILEMISALLEEDG
jgi:hypothetical protein